LLRATYDHRTDTLHLRLGTGPVAGAHRPHPRCQVEIDHAGRVVTIAVHRPGTAWPVSAIIDRYRITGPDQHLLRLTARRWRQSGPPEAGRPPTLQ